MKNLGSSLTRALSFLLFAALMLPSAAFALRDQFVQEGLVLAEDGRPMEGRHDIRIRLYAAGDQPIFDELHRGVDMFEGYYAVVVGSVEDLDPADFIRPEVSLGISFDGGQELAPRTPLVKSPGAFSADVAINVIGDITPNTVSVGGGVVIDARGRWVGDPTGLIGPRGPIGVRGPAGVQGPSGADGPPLDPQDAVPLVVAALAADPSALPYIRDDQNDTKRGHLTMAGGSVVVNGGTVQFQGAGGRNALLMGNNDITGVNRLVIEDPGPTEGIIWAGSQAKIVVSPLNNANSDGMLRLINDAGISLESTVRVSGNVDLRAALSIVGTLTANVARITTATITNANITNLNGPGNRINVNGDLALNRNVIIGGGTNFIGTMRAGAVVSGGAITAGSNISAGGTISAGGNVQSGAGGQVRAGRGGMWVNGTQVFDGNANLLRAPAHSCPQGRLMFSTGANGVARCVNVTCPAGSAFRGFNANLTPVCEVDDRGLASIPARTCGAGQSLYRITSNGSTTCRASGGTTPGMCPSPRFMVGINANNTIACNCTSDAHCGGGEWCSNNRCIPGCRSDANCPNSQWCSNHQCVNGCRNDNYCPRLQWCSNHRCIPGCKNNAECGGGRICRNHSCVPSGVNITPNNSAYGHHGRCSGWNGCGNARTCATWACQLRGASLVSYGRSGSCRGFRVCHLFYSRGRIQWNWGNWCGVYGVGGIVCSR